MAPLWPLQSFVAVNPFLGLADKSFAEASLWLDRVARTQMLMTREFYASQIDAGIVSDDDIAAALATGPRVEGIASVQDFRIALSTATDRRDRQVVATIAELLDGLSDGDREVSRTAFMVEEISKWCAGYFDEGQAVWRSPWRDMPLYPAWRAAMQFDRNPEAMGLRRFRATVASLPEAPDAAIAAIVSHLGIPERAYEDYLCRALFDVQGWASYARYRGWQAELEGRADDTLLHLLAIRLAWGFALFEERRDDAVRGAWRDAMRRAEVAPDDKELSADDDLSVRALAQEAYDHAAQRRLLRQLEPRVVPAPRSVKRPAAQVAFCIDVRSEMIRRALEGQSQDIETLGFAGFFGAAFEYVRFGNVRGELQSPVLLKPGMVICEAVKDASPREEDNLRRRGVRARRMASAWKSFQGAAVSSFSFVETMGLAFALRIVGEGVGLTRRARDGAHMGLAHSVRSRLGPQLSPDVLCGRDTGAPVPERIRMAEAILRAMSMTGNFARLIVLVGHGATTVNNPHASGLNCGACGGHTGEANAQVVAAILNDPAVRSGLSHRGMAIPSDAVFLAGLHDTTTDEVTILNRDAVPPTHLHEFAELERALSAAGQRARCERAPLLGVTTGAHMHAAIQSRSRDWSQVRPEWGLAGNSAFIAAPRARTREVSLAGRAFLHNYDWREDKDFAVLELIMTAPMVVASWINLQYFGSTVNNRAFGSGNKTLHNVVGALGVLEGNGGDLRTGLPWQSVHDDRRLVHEPHRLNVFIEAPVDAINRVIARHAAVRNLVDNKWLHLFALDESGVQRYWREGKWIQAAMPLPSQVGS